MKESGTNIHYAILLVFLIVLGVSVWNHQRATQALGQVHIITSPPNARVFLDGRDYGLSPVTVTGITPGLRHLVLKKPGYHVYDRQLNFMPNQRSEFMQYLSSEALEIRDTFQFNANAPRGILQGDSSLFIVSSNGQLSALDQETLQPLWQSSLERTLVAAPKVLYGELYIATHQGDLLSFNEEAGSLTWEQELSFPIENLYVAKEYLLALGNTEVACLNLKGEVLWSMALPGRILSRSVFVFLDTLSLVTREGMIYTFALPTGALQSKRELNRNGTLGIQLIQSLFHEDGLVVVNSRGHVGISSREEDYALRYTILSVESPQLVCVLASTLFISSEKGTLFALDTTTGDILWERELATETSILLLHQDTLYAGCHDGSFFVLQRQTGEVLAKRQLPAQVVSIAQSTPDSLFLALRNGTVHRLFLPPELRGKD